MDEKEKRWEHLTRTTTQELVALRTQIQELQRELMQAKERVVEAATRSQQAQVVTEPVRTTRKQPEPVALQTGPESEKIIETLQEKLRAQEALREKEWEQRKLVEDNRRRMEEGLRKGRANYDRLQEEKEKLQKRRTGCVDRPSRK